MRVKRSCLSLPGWSAVMLLIWATCAVAQDEGDAAAPGDRQDETATGDDVGESSSGADAEAVDIEATVPTLDELLSVAFRHNPEIRAASAEVEVAEAALERARLSVVKETTAYRQRWLAAMASLAEAEAKLEHTERLHERGFAPDTQLQADRFRVQALQVELREIETELPFLLGSPLGGNVFLTGDPAADDNQARIEDDAIPLAEQILTLSMRSLQAGEGDLQQCVTWSTRLLELQVETAESDDERRAAVEEHLNRLRTLLKMADTAIQTGTMRMEEGLAVRFAIVKGELFLAESVGAD